MESYNFTVLDTGLYRVVSIWCSEKQCFPGFGRFVQARKGKTETPGEGGVGSREAPRRRAELVGGVAAIRRFFGL